MRNTTALRQQIKDLEDLVDRLEGEATRSQQIASKSIEGLEKVMAIADKAKQERAAALDAAAEAKVESIVASRTARTNTIEDLRDLLASKRRSAPMVKINELTFQVITFDDLMDLLDEL